MRVDEIADLRFVCDRFAGKDRADIGTAQDQDRRNMLS